MDMFEALPARTEAIGKEVVDSAYRVHKALGPGLMESVYQACLAHELRQRNLNVGCQVTCPIVYKKLVIENSLRMDLVVEDSVIIELKSVEQLLPIHSAQLLTYLRLSGRRLGFLINFNVLRIRDGLHRMVV